MNESSTETNIDQNKRNFVKKAAYSAPAIVTMAALPSFASAGSGFKQQRPRRDPTRRNGANHHSDGSYSKHNR